MNMQPTSDTPANNVQVIFGWIWVAIPLLWGVYQTLLNVAKLFQ